jgi:chemotaxis protein MotB
MSTKRVRSPHHEEEHENTERWLLTYADMITLLMVLFIVLFAIGQTDLAKFDALRHSLATAFGGPAKPNPVINGGSGVLTSGSEIDGAVPEASGALGSPVPSSQAEVALVQVQQAQDEATAERQTLSTAETQIENALVQKGLQGDVSFRLESRGLVVTVVTDHLLYDTDSAEIQPAGQAVLDAVAPVLLQLPNDISIEGHTDDEPVTGGPYATNWELSTARATAVLRYLLAAYQFDPARLSASGYADTRPLVPNTSAANRALNRRVEIVVLNQNVNLQAVN